jgi:transposase
MGWRSLDCWAEGLCARRDHHGRAGRTRRLRPQPRVRALPRLGRPAVADERADVRRLVGQTLELIDGRSGENRQAQILVAVMGASSYTYAELRRTQTLPDWIGSHVRALAFMGGVLAQLVSDNPRRWWKAANPSSRLGRSANRFSFRCRHGADIASVYPDRSNELIEKIGWGTRIRT